MSAAMRLLATQGLDIHGLLLDTLCQGPGLEPSLSRQMPAAIAGARARAIP